MLDEVIKILISAAVSVCLGVIFGHSAVYIFNKLPASWLTDYGEIPSEELKDPSVQRIKSLPYKWIFTSLFTAVGMSLLLVDVIFAIPALCALWVLLEIAISDIKYMIIPDQFLILLAVIGVGFVPYYVDQGESITLQLVGAAVGFGIMLFIGILTKMIFKRESLGFGDIKLCGIIGLLTGAEGVIIIICAGFILGALVSVFKIGRKKLGLKDESPVGQFFCGACGLYIIFIMAYGLTPNLLAFGI